MTIDLSEGWDAIAEQFIAARSGIGTERVRSWARDCLPPGSTIVDVGCGSGAPVAEGLVLDGYTVYGIDASRKMIAAFHQRFPHMPTAWEAAQHSAFFHRSFIGAISIGLLFLLSDEVQAEVLSRVAGALEDEGRFLFSAPRQTCRWQDVQTRRPSHSLGEREYQRILELSGMRIIRCYLDEGGNNYFDAVKKSRF